MSYDLEYKKTALKEWHKLDNSIKQQFKKKLASILQHPHVPANRLSGFEESSVYKIKLKRSAYRLVYRVCDNTVVVTVVAVGKRDKNWVYKKAFQRV